MKLPLEDRLDLQDLIADYSWALDTGDEDALVACFTETAVMSEEVFDEPDIWEGHAGIYKFLVENGANVDALAPNRSSPLMMAAREGHVEVVKLLLTHSANPSLRNDSDATALSWALKTGHSTIADLLRGAGAKE